MPTLEAYGLFFYRLKKARRDHYKVKGQGLDNTLEEKSGPLIMMLCGVGMVIPLARTYLWCPRNEIIKSVK